ncbi:MAG: 50S ribosomal protein L11 methyltransferase [Rhodospirillales bacterium]|nr:50S ribosomal protein L11 methyltransferase [Rhodospirillales bacterium]
MATAPLWRVVIDATRATVDAIETVLASLGFHVASRAGADGVGWTVEAYAEGGLDEDAVIARLAALPPDAHLTYALEPVRVRDWVAENQRSFAPIAVGRFFVHASHDRGLTSPGRIVIEIDPGTAFGSGRHGSTVGCLEGIDDLARRRRITRPLDLGTGSGILALAMARTWRIPVLAVDIDPEAVRVARINARQNRVAAWVRAEVADGVATGAAARGPRFDLIVANVFARPLRHLSRPLVRRLAPGGIMMLGGFSATDEAFVVVPYRDLGLRLLRRYDREGWRTLVLKR